MPAPRSKAQRIVQQTLRWTTPLLVLAALGGTTVDGIFAGGRMLSEPHPASAVDSPDHRYRALIYLNNENGKGTSVVVEHQWHGIHLGQFTALAHDASPVDQIAVKWTAPDQLAIRCDECSPADTDIAQTNWGTLHFSYDLGKTAPKP